MIRNGMLLGLRREWELRRHKELLDIRDLVSNKAFEKMLRDWFRNK
jgi:hypothetical protein